MGIWGALLAAALVPVWHSPADSISVASYRSGRRRSSGGLLDHRVLVAGFGAADDLDVEGTHGVA